MRTAIAIAAASILGGCAQMSREFKSPTPVEKFPTQTAPRTLEKSSDVLDAAEAEASIQVDETSFMVRPVRLQDVDLPDFYVHSMSATESGVQDALQLMLEGSGLTLNVEGGSRAMERFGSTSLQNVHGGLRDVLDALSERIGFFWSASKGVVTIEPDRLFVAELPPVLAEDSLSNTANTLQYLGARDSYLDRIARTIVFRANRKALETIDQYLEGIRATRSMLVYEVQIFQVDLTDEHQRGIGWNRLNAKDLNRVGAADSGVSIPKTAADFVQTFAATATGSGLGAVIMGPNFSVDALVQFMKTQGSVKTVSQPRLAMLNGAKGLLRVGQTTTYVSKVGSNLSSGVSQITVETKDLRTGMELGITGDEHDGTITTRVSLTLSELVRMNAYVTLGTELKLPDVTDREIKTVIRLPPGYTALLGGITVERESEDTSNAVQGSKKSQEVRRSEIVMVLKPTIVRFKKRVVTPAAVVAQAQEPKPKPATAPIAAVLTPKIEAPVQIDAVLPALPEAARGSAKRLLTRMVVPAAIATSKVPPPTPSPVTLPVAPVELKASAVTSTPIGAVSKAAVPTPRAPAAVSGPGVNVQQASLYTPFIAFSTPAVKSSNAGSEQK